MRWLLLAVIRAHGSAGGSTDAEEAYLTRWKPTELLFPAADGQMICDLRISLGTALRRAGISRRVTWHTFRHTYTAARMQTLDHGQPVSPYTVMRELGHSSLKQIEDTYGHLQQTRLRCAVVEYRETKVLAMGATAEIRGTVAGTSDRHPVTDGLAATVVSA